MSHSALLIARVSGLPAGTMDGFSTRLVEQMDLIALRESALSSARNQLVDRLHAAIHNAPSERRHNLLAAKRDCFNGRPLSRHLGKSSWKFVEEADSGLALRIIALEKDQDELRHDFASQYQHECARQYRRLGELISD